MKQLKYLFTIAIAFFVLTTACKDNESEEGDSNISITGTVTDMESGDLLSGVLVSSGTTTSTTGIDGKYSIQAQKDGTLTFSKTDYIEKSENINERTTIDITLTSSIDNSTIYAESEFVKEFDNVDQTFTIVDVFDRGEGTGTITWTSDKIYVLNGFVFINSGQTLTIEKGTIIKGAAGQGESSSALIVAQGGKIDAVGTADEPIIFTSSADQIYRNSNGTFGTSQLNKETSGLWGGVILLGKASLAKLTETNQIEGIPITETRGLYGGKDDTDNSGTLKYISIRHGGTDIGSGNEINGLTFGGVGSETTVEFIEVYANADDGFEWFGGTVNTKYLFSFNNGDECFDFDEGWSGNNQFWFSYQETQGDNNMECDGGHKDCQTCEPYATPSIYNATFQGRGKNRAARIRENAGGFWHNSIFINWDKSIEVELTTDAQDSYKQFEDGNLVFSNNIFSDVAGGILVNIEPGSDEDKENSIQAAFDNWGNTSETPALDANWVPIAGGASSMKGSSPPSNGFFHDVNYRGAFETGSTRWIDGWTKGASDL